MTTLLLLPFAGLLEKLAVLTIRDKKTGDEDEEEDDNIGLEVLDERFLVSPTLALNQCKTTVEAMAKLARKNFRNAVKLFDKYEQKKIDRIQEREDKIDRMEDTLGNYLVKLADCELTDEDSKEVTYLLHLISEFERIGDYSINIVEQAMELQDKKLSFSESTKQELKTIADAVEEIISLSYDTFRENDLSIAKKIEPLEETIDEMEDILKSRHVERLRDGRCSVDTGIVFLDLLVNLERISDHCSNIAVYTVSNNYGKESINHHEYIRKLHQSSDARYVDAMHFYHDKYTALIENSEPAPTASAQ